MRRAAVYDKFWPSQGGGERHAGKLAEVLAADGWSVDLLGHGGVDRDDLASHLGLDLSRTALRDVPDRGDDALAEVSAEYDLFVTASHMSRLRPRAAHNVYLCWFPTPLDFAAPAWRRWLLRHVPRGSLPTRGWHPPEGGLRRAWSWTNGDGVLDGVRRLDVGRPGGPPTQLVVADESGATLAEVGVTGEFRRLVVPGGVVHLRSDVFVPGGGDWRDLGVAVSRVRGDGRPWWLSRWPWLAVDPADVSFLDAYDAVLANSEFTRSWIARLWGRDAAVLYPPIRLAATLPETAAVRAVVTVGRFFAPGSGHAKRQLEMVRAFGDLHRAGRLPGWTFHVVGGVEPAHEPYLAEVRAAATGLPVEVHPNAPRAEVDRLLGEASVFWAATGLGEDEDRAPWNMEHFGMTTVEAMAAGCVPVVIDRAGQREIVRDGVDGFRWRSLAELGERTVQVATDDALRTRLAAAAVQRAAEFSDAAFADRWHAIAGDLGY